jgi:hypothetical protein
MKLNKNIYLFSPGRLGMVEKQGDLSSKQFVLSYCQTSTILF